MDDGVFGGYGDVPREDYPRRGATAPRPPAHISSAGPPAKQRRAALDFLSRELQALEIDQRVKRDLETQVGSLEEKLARSEQLNQQYLRRIQMLEQELQQARRAAAPPPADVGAAAPSSAAAPAGPPKLLGTSLAAAAAKLPPSLAAPPANDATQDDEFDIDRLIQEQRDQPLPQGSAAAGKRAPIALRVPSRPS
jgi:small-conductance mechanosensitive channel